MFKKFIWVIGFITVFAIPTLAQQQEYNLKLTNEEVNIIAKALGKMPFDDVASLFQKLRQQIVAQQQPPQLPTTSEVQKKEEMEKK